MKGIVPELRSTSEKSLSFKYSKIGFIWSKDVKRIGGFPSRKPC